MTTYSDDSETPRHLKSPSMDSFPFFADAQLDLEEAHDIADTPEATRPQMVDQRMAIMDRNLQLPSLNGTLRSGGATTMALGDPPNDDASLNDRRNIAQEETKNADSNEEKRSFSRITSNLEISTQQPKRKPRVPRDIPWLVGFVCFVPLTLLVTSLQTPTGALARHPLSFATLHAITWTALATLILSRGLYQTAAAGEGDDTRQHIASGLIWLARTAPLVALVLFIILWSSGLRRYSLIFLLLSIRSGATLTRSWNAKTAFVSAMTCMALDILSRSLRRASFLRSLMAVLALQTFLMVWWRRALLGSKSSFGTLCAFMAGQWAMWTVQKVLAYLAATGVMDWCSQQLTLLTTIPEEDSEFDDDDNYDLPEAYSTVDASVYQSVLVTEDELLDDDYDEELDKEVQDQSPSNQSRQQQHGLPTQMHRATVKSTLISAFTISFGSIAHAGLLGSVSHFLWRHKLFPSFATAHSDIGLAHTAVYYKNHSKGSRDVLTILSSSGMEGIVRDDISQSMCNLVTSTLTCCIVLVTTYLLLHQRKSHSDITDPQVFRDTLFSFILSFNLISTATEPLTAAIKASYVAFSQSPRCLSQAYPLIYHRLNRLSGNRRR